MIQDIFSHASEVKTDGERYIPMRFTQKALKKLGKIQPMFRDTASCSAGISLKFYTDAEEVSFDYKYDILYTRSGGLDIYENGIMSKTINLPMESCIGKFTYTKESDAETLIEIFLPSNGQFALWNFQLGNYRPAPDKGKKLVLYYGDSLTHSAYITQGSLSWVCCVSRMTGTDYINRGIGSLFYDMSYLDDQENLDPYRVFVQFGGNDLVKHDEENKVVFIDGEPQFCDCKDIPKLEQNARKYLAKLKEIYPEAEVFVISKISGLDPISEERLEVERMYNKVLENVAFDLRINFIDSRTIITPTDGYYVADNIHYNIEGNAAFAEGILPYMGIC